MSDPLAELRRGVLNLADSILKKLEKKRAKSFSWRDKA